MTTRRDVLKQGVGLGALFGTLSLSEIARAQEALKIGIAYVSPMAEFGWTKQHALAIDAVKAKLGDKVEVSQIENIYQPQDAERVFREYAASGHKLIFGTSFSHGTPMQKVAPQFPDVAFEHCSGIKGGPNLGTFEARYYEGTYLAGIASGKMTKSNKIGFIGGFPIPDLVGPANSWLLGARSVNPAVTCTNLFLNSWFDPAKEKEATNALISQGCDVIFGWTDTAAAAQVAGQQGVWSISEASDVAPLANGKQLAALTFDWSSVYIKAAEDVLAGTWTAKDRWLGLKEGIVKMAPYNEAIPADVISLLQQKEQEIKDGKLLPYAGEIKDQAGTVRVPAGSSMTDPEIRGMNWFVEGMIGNLG